MHRWTWRGVSPVDNELNQLGKQSAFRLFGLLAAEVDDNLARRTGFNQHMGAIDVRH